MSLTQAWRALRGCGGLTVREVACVGAAGTLLVADWVARPEVPRIALAAFESPSDAARWALLSIARDGLLSNQFAYRLWPSIGESARRGGPEWSAITTANRDRHFTLAIELHESDVAEFTVVGAVDEDDGMLARRLTWALGDAGYAADCARAGSAYEPFLPRRMTARSLVLVAPIQHAWERRIAMHRIAVVAALVDTSHPG